MYEIRDGRYYFVLIDFDMAVCLGNGKKRGQAGKGSLSATSENRTGTLPFMACELVRDAYKAIAEGQKWVPKPHLLRHDYESLFHVSFWSSAALKREGDPDPLVEARAKIVKLMETGTLDALARFKKILCMEGLKQNRVHLSEPLRILEPWFLQWALFFNDVYYARTSLLLKQEFASPPPAYDDETINGLFTRDTLQAMLTRAIPAKSRKRETRPFPLKLEDDDDDDDEDLLPANTKGKSKRDNAGAKMEVNNVAKKDGKGAKNVGKEPIKEAAKEPKKGGGSEPEKFSKESIAYRSRLRSSKK